MSLQGHNTQVESWSICYAWSSILSLKIRCFLHFFSSTFLYFQHWYVIMASKFKSWLNTAIYLPSKNISNNLAQWGIEGKMSFVMAYSQDHLGRQLAEEPPVYLHCVFSCSCALAVADALMLVQLLTWVA